MGRSKSVGFRLPLPIVEALEIRLSRGEYGDYGHHAGDSPERVRGLLSEFQVGQNLYASFLPREHLFTAVLSKMRREVQNQVHDFSLRLAERNLLITDLHREKPFTAATVVRLAEEWPDDRLAKFPRLDKPRTKSHSVECTPAAWKWLEAEAARHGHASVAEWAETESSAR